MITPEFIHRRFISNIDSKSDISCISIPDGLEMEKPRDFFAIEKAMENTMPTHLESLVQKLSEDGEVVECMVVDLLASWANGVGHRCGVPVAGFWPAMLATYQLIAAIPDMVRTQLISDTGTPQHPAGPLRFLPDQPLLSTEDLPWLIGTPPSRKARFKFWTRALDRSRNLPWLLVNSFPDEFINHDKPQNGALIENSMNQPRIFQVGSLSKHALVKNPSFWEEDLSCLQWLDKQKLNSVLYISFGSWVTPEFIHRRFISNIDSKSDISCISIPDGLEMEKPSEFFAIEKAMENTMPTHLESLVQKLSEDGEVVACMVVDLLASWANGVGHRCGVPVAGFWPAMLATYQLIAAIPDMVRTQLISDTGTPQHPAGPLRFLPDQPLLSTEDLPWLIGTPPSRKARFKFWTRAFDRSRNLPWLLVNSFPEEFINHDKPQNAALLENSMNQPRIFQVGSLSKHALVKNPSFWEEDLSCLQWLDKQKLNSVLYISFGSWVSPIGEGNVKKLALTLEEIGLPFLWVLGPTWKDGLPSGYIERVAKQGTVVSWAPQHEVLQHEAVTCYLTHCGWNSTMEAIRCQKRLLCYPVAGDQFVNCAYITEKWKIGVRISGLGQKEMERGLRRVMDDKKMSDRLERLRERTMGEEASSVMMSNLATFVNDFKKQTDGMFPTDLAI